MPRHTHRVMAAALLVLLAGCSHDQAGGATCVLGFGTTVLRFAADVAATATGQDQPYPGDEVSDPTDEYCSS
jgi:hypothetical protein